mmetsp:Transcript_69954/g.198261  ORF Transcript_69954/g.198261 Transcript_69954/m.198261 type:complete len:245 (+) Transcript_69954:99-833(+)
MKKRQVHVVVVEPVPFAQGEEGAGGEVGDPRHAPTVDAHLHLAAVDPLQGVRLDAQGARLPGREVSQAKVHAGREEPGAVLEVKVGQGGEGRPAVLAGRGERALPGQPCDGVGGMRDGSCLLPSLAGVVHEAKATQQPGRDVPGSACSPTGHAADIVPGCAWNHAPQGVAEHVGGEGCSGHVAVHEPPQARWVPLHLLLQQPYQMNGALAVPGYDEGAPGCLWGVDKVQKGAPHIAIGQIECKS